MIAHTMTKAEIARISVPVFRKHHVRRAGLFGSYARGEQQQGSDLDFLVEFSGKVSLFTLGVLKDELEAAFGLSCDVLTYNSIETEQSELSAQIQNEAETLYDER